MPLRFKPFIKDLFASTLVTGLETLDKEAEPYVPESIKRILEASPLPEDFKKFILPLAEKGVSTPLGQFAFMAIGMALGFALGMISPVIKLGQYEAEKLTKTFRLPPDLVYRLMWKLYKGEELPPELKYHLTDQGWSDETIEQGKEASKVIPTPSDIIAFLAHEVFEPRMIEKYGLDSEWELIDKEPAKRIGMDEETLRDYWRNHWVHPALSSVYAMLHRDLITPQDMFEYYRLVETPEYWRNKLTELSWDMPNRVEIRMMTRYLDLDKEFVKDMLKKAGLHENYRDAAADFMIIMGLFGYWSALYRNGWVTAEELRKLMEAKGLEPAIVERMYVQIVKAEKPQRVEEHRKLTRGLIIKGLKKGAINREQAIEMLMRHQNYDRPEAEFIIDVEVGMEGSPETPLEFRMLVEEARAAQGLDYIKIPPELIEAEKKMVETERKLKEAIAAKEPEGVIASLQADLEFAKVRFRELKALHQFT